MSENIREYSSLYECVGTIMAHCGWSFWPRSYSAMMKQRRGEVFKNLLTDQVLADQLGLNRVTFLRLTKQDPPSFLQRQRIYADRDPRYQEIAALFQLPVQAFVTLVSAHQEGAPWPASGILEPEEPSPMPKPEPTDFGTLITELIDRFHKDMKKHRDDYPKGLIVDTFVDRIIILKSFVEDMPQEIETLRGSIREAMALLLFQINHRFVEVEVQKTKLALHRSLMDMTDVSLTPPTPKSHPHK